MNVTTATPAEIDTALAAIHNRAATPANRFASYAKAALDARHPRYGRTDEAQAARYDALAAKAEDEYDAIMAECAPFDAEYTARGGWTRAFIVADGHVHRSMDCHTCYPTTRFGWLPQVSGQTEAEIVTQAGEGACTVCYPTAPVVAKGTRTLFTEDEIAKGTRRVEREARSAEIAAKKEANRLEMTVVDAYGRNERIHTVTEAKAFLTDAFDTSWTHKMPDVQTLAAVAAALGDKLGTSSQAQMAAAEKRGAKRGR